MIKSLKYIFFILLLFNSCTSIKMARAEKFYDEWLSKSRPIAQKEYDDLNLIHQKVYDVYETFLQKILNDKPLGNSSNLKYLIIEPTLRVALCDSLIRKNNLNNTGYVYETVNQGESYLYNLKPRSNRDDYQALYYNLDYQLILKSRNKFKTSSVYGFRDWRKALARFTGRTFYNAKKPNYSRMYYKEPSVKIRSITFTKDLKKAIVVTNSTYSYIEYLVEYSTITDSWDYKEFFQLVE